MLKLAIAFTNFGPYHISRLRALGNLLQSSGGELIAYELAGTQQLYPWKTAKEREPFRWTTLFPEEVVENLSNGRCRQAMTEALERDCPDGVGVVGYSRPESTAMIQWARSNDRPAVLMCESQEVDHPRVWWKEAVKRRIVRKCAAGFVGGARHRDYLVKLGMDQERIVYGYNAVDGRDFAEKADAARLSASPLKRSQRPYFLAISRFAKEKNLPRLIQAYQRYRNETSAEGAWDLVLCGDGPERMAVEAEIKTTGLTDSIHTPGFLQADALASWLAHASAFVHPAISEPWGLVVNEAAACGLPLLVTERAGAVETFVPETTMSTGRRLDPFDVESMAACLHWMADLPASERQNMGSRAAGIAAQWGPERFASGCAEAFQIAFAYQSLNKSRPYSLVG